jgi:hypothetical protein
MDVAADLLIRANRYRGMAARVTDEETRMALLDLAAKYEALAREIKQTTRRSRPRSPPPHAALSRAQSARTTIRRTGRLLPSIPVISSTLPAPAAAAVVARLGDDLADGQIALCRVDLVHHPVLAAPVAGDSQIPAREGAERFVESLSAGR